LGGPSLAVFHSDVIGGFEGSLAPANLAANFKTYRIEKLKHLFSGGLRRQLGELLRVSQGLTLMTRCY
jgi:hypothetical protein